jgi:hypothetical protein
MRTVRAQFDGEKVILSEQVPDMPPGEVIVIFETIGKRSEESLAWLGIQEAALSKVWDNDEDSIYDAV